MPAHVAAPTTRRSSPPLRADAYFRAGIWITALALFLSPILQTLKLLDFGSSIARAFFYFKLSATSLVFAASFLTLLGRNRLRLGPLELLLGFLLVWGGTVTLFFGGTPIDIGGNLLRVAFVLACFQTARRYGHTPDVGGALRKFAVAGIAGVLAGLVLLYSLGVFGPRPVYLGLSTQGLFIPLAYVLAREGKRDWLWIGLIMALIVAGGKRGNMLAALGMVLVGVLFVREMSARKVLAVSAVTAGMAFLLVGADLARVSGALPAPFANRFLPWIPGAGGGPGIDLVEATATRFSEVLAVVEMWKENTIATISGFGLGAAIPKGYGTEASTVHVSPVALAFQYGIPLAVLVVGAICWIPVRWLLEGRRARGTQERTWWLTGVGLLALSATVMTVFQDPVLWMALGTVAATNRGGE